MAYVHHPDTPQFFSGDACKAAGIDAQTLKNWVTRDPPVILMTDEDRESFAAAGIKIEGPSHERLAKGSGRSHLFTFRRVMQIALTAELVRLGLPPRKAGTIAAGFTDVGDGTGGFVGDEDPEIERYPGQLYPSGMTLLVVGGGDDFGNVMKADFKTPMLDVFASTDRTNGEEHAIAVVVVNLVQGKVMKSLGLDLSWFR